MRPPSPRRVRRGALAVVAVVVVSCGGSARPPPAAPPPASGHESPGAATAGFIRGLVYGGQRACAYVVPASVASCLTAFPPATSFSVSGLGLGETTVRGSQALVNVTGELCTTQAGSTTCASNHRLNTGQPRNSGAAAFAAAYNPSQLESISKRAIPCQMVGGRWYVDLGS